MKKEVQISTIETVTHVVEVKAADGEKGAPGPAAAGPAIGLEEALELTGFGKFSVKLIGGLWLCMTTLNFSGTDVAYALPAAQCDLQFSAMERGWINASLFFGMISTAFVWGALSDKLGRKYPLVLSYAAITASSLVNALFVSSAWAFLVCRIFLGAMLIATPTLSMTYAGELFGKTYRSRVFMWGGTLQAVSAAVHADGDDRVLNIVQNMIGCGALLPRGRLALLTGLAMWIIPMQLTWLRSWRVFLLITTLTNAAAGLYLLMLPESPKSLAVRGRQRESIVVLADMFSSNTGLPADVYPVRALTLPRGLVSEDGANPFVVMGRQFAKLCRPPYRTPLLFAIAVQPMILFCQNTIRMWVPTIFAEMQTDLDAGLTESRDVCTILGSRGSASASNASAPIDCDTFRVDGSVYLNSVIIMLARACFQLTAGFTIHTLGRKVCLVSTLTLACSTLIAWPFAASATVVLMIACFFEGLGNVGFTTLMNITVDLFPTSVRSSAVSLANFAGRVGSMVGNIAFPLLLSIDCSLAFWTGAGLLGFAAVLSLFKPRPSFTPTPNSGLGAKMLAEQRASMASVASGASGASGHSQASRETHLS